MINQVNVKSRPLSAEQRERRQLLTAQIGQHKGYGIKRQIKQRRENHQADKKAPNENLSALETTLPKGQGGEAPDAVAERVTRQKQESDAHAQEPPSRKRNRPKPKRPAKKPPDADKRQKKIKLPPAD